MSVAEVLEITATSNQSFEDAVRRGIAKANETVRSGEPAHTHAHES